MYIVNHIQKNKFKDRYIKKSISQIFMCQCRYDICMSMCVYSNISNNICIIQGKAQTFLYIYILHTYT